MEDKSLTADKICISDEQSSSSLYSVSFSNRLTECVTVNGRRGRDEVTVRRRSSELTASCTDTSCSVSNCLSLSLSLYVCVCVSADRIDGCQTQSQTRWFSVVMSTYHYGVHGVYICRKTWQNGEWNQRAGKLWHVLCSGIAYSLEQQNAGRAQTVFAKHLVFEIIILCVVARTVTSVQ